MHKKILVPMALEHDLSPHLLAVAKALLADGGEIHALHVFEKPYGLAAAMDDETLGNAKSRAHKLLIEKLDAHPDIQGHFVEGRPHRTIVEFANENSVDCIVIGSHQPDLTDYLLGSTAARVVRHASCSVHVSRGK